ncbi:hypothetical protein AAG906_040523 [Vitis piasezkii]
MASEGGSAMPGRDSAWKYCSPIEDDDDEDADDEDWDAYRSVVRASKHLIGNVNNMRIL